MAELQDPSTLPGERRRIHLRRISCEGFERPDGLIDIEGTLTDTKPEPIAMLEKNLAAGEPIHRMVLRIAIDRDRVIREAEARTLDSPYGICGNITASYGKLVGLRIEPGFTKTIKRMFRGVAGCTHITELLPPMATTAFQILWDGPDAKSDADDESKRSSPLDGCHALRRDGEIVRLHFPHEARPG